MRGTFKLAWFVNGHRIVKSDIFRPSQSLPKEVCALLVVSEESRSHGAVPVCLSSWLLSAGMVGMVRLVIAKYLASMAWSGFEKSREIWTGHLGCHLIPLFMTLPLHVNSMNVVLHVARCSIYKNILCLKSLGDAIAILHVINLTQHPMTKKLTQLVAGKNGRKMDYITTTTCPFILHRQKGRVGGVESDPHHQYRHTIIEQRLPLGSTNGERTDS